MTRYAILQRLRFHGQEKGAMRGFFKKKDVGRGSVKHEAGCVQLSQKLAYYSLTNPWKLNKLLGISHVFHWHSLAHHPASDPPPNPWFQRQDTPIEQSTPTTLPHSAPEGPGDY